MPRLNTRIPQYKKQKDIVAEWKTFRKGLNLLLRPTELERDELAQADNIMLVGSGVPTGRWGTSEYFSVNATGSIRGFATFVNTTSGTNDIIALTDEGYLAKKNGTSSTRIYGSSYPSGSVVRAEQLGGMTFIVSKDRPLATYTGATLSLFATLSAPTGVTATNYSGATGTSSFSWRITTLSDNGGETQGSTAFELPNLPQNLEDTEVRVRWTLATGSVSGYQVYRGRAGDERFLASVGASISEYVDRGQPAAETQLSPIENTTGGVLSEFVIKFKDRLVMVDSKQKSRLLISARYPNQNSFSYSLGGTDIFIDPDSGEDITGIAVQPGDDKIIVYKDSSHYAVTLSNLTVGNFFLTEAQYQPISTLIGASSQDTIHTVENDTFYFGRKGLYVTGFEPNFLNIIRTNEVSAKMRPYLALLNDTDYRTACAMYVDKKYILSFPRRRECIVYDRERGAWYGPWKTPYGIGKMLRHVDDTGTERWILGSYNTNQTYIFNAAVNTDAGTAMQKVVRTNREDFGEWSLLKIVKLFYSLFRSVRGQVTVNLLAELRDGSTTSIKSFTISGSAAGGATGFGVNMWGNTTYGTSAGSPIVSPAEETKYTQLFKSIRLLQVEVQTTTANSNFELLQLRATASSQGEGSLSSASRV